MQEKESIMFVLCKLQMTVSTAILMTEFIIHTSEPLKVLILC